MLTSSKVILHTKFHPMTEAFVGFIPLPVVVVTGALVAVPVTAVAMALRLMMQLVATPAMFVLHVAGFIS
jgi:hypothetical protein